MSDSYLSLNRDILTLLKTYASIPPCVHPSTGEFTMTTDDCITEDTRKEMQRKSIECLLLLLEARSLLTQTLRGCEANWTPEERCARRYVGRTAYTCPPHRYCSCNGTSSDNERWSYERLKQLYHQMPQVTSSFGISPRNRLPE